MWPAKVSFNSERASSRHTRSLHAAHAWVEVECVPIGEPSEPDRPYLLPQRR